MADRFCTRGDLLTERFDDVLIVVDVRAGKVHELNSTAAFVLERIDGCKDADELADILCHCYDTDLATANSDVHALLEQFVESGLLLKRD